MPRLWKEEASGKFIAIPLDAREQFEIAPKLLLLNSAGKRGAWALLASAETAPPRVNGERLVLGMRVLRDRDLIQLANDSAAAIFFSTDSSPTVAPLGADRPLPCALCRAPIRPEQLAVRCPMCGAAHHQDADSEYACWTYGEVCAACRKQPTALDDRHVWTPQEFAL